MNEQVYVQRLRHTAVFRSGRDTGPAASVLGGVKLVKLLLMALKG